MTHPFGELPTRPLLSIERGPRGSVHLPFGDAPNLRKGLERVVADFPSRAAHVVAGAAPRGSRIAGGLLRPQAAFEGLLNGLLGLLRLLRNGREHTVDGRIEACPDADSNWRRAAHGSATSESIRQRPPLKW